MGSPNVCRNLQVADTLTPHVNAIPWHKRRLQIRLLNSSFAEHLIESYSIAPGRLATAWRHASGDTQWQITRLRLLAEALIANCQLIPRLVLPGSLLTG